MAGVPDSCCRIRLVFALALVSCAIPAQAVPQLEVTASGFLFHSGVVVGGPFVAQNGATGPLDTNYIEAGAIFNYPAPGSSTFNLEATAFAGAQARADYGSNGAFVSLGLRPTDGTDRGSYSAGDYSGFPVNSTLGPNASASSMWTDSFVILGGTGVGSATVNVDLSGRAYRNVGTGMANESAFDSFNTRGWGILKYSLDIDYDGNRPTGVDPEYSQPIRLEQQWSTGQRVFNTDNLPDLAIVIGQPPPLIGSFVFEYGVPFELTSSLSVTGYDMVTLDYLHTALLSLFTLPEGASLSSGSGHLYAIAGGNAGNGNSIPEPSTMWLLSCAMLGLIGASRRRKAQPG